ncbi:hypothetical protein Pla52o_55910 [Novipirellula galeiformis]|uniref:Uncharacterized protein n=1 Tax=Novipirellula galeiformis TaxID=2528004 RepID=A0A5C6BG65_9BACT|nr:hypothetical protein [Novipirellula galeiformis]TWU11153.1 hypothetical protein Pla52o_55910 [Novipirellula galeiformis]
MVTRRVSERIHAAILRLWGVEKYKPQILDAQSVFLLTDRIQVARMQPDRELAGRDDISLRRETEHHDSY